MSYFFTNAFRKALKDNPALMTTGAVVTARLLTSMPSLAFGADQYVGAVNVADLTATPGWEAALGTMPSQGVSTTTATVGGITSTFVVMPSAMFPFTTAVRAEGVAFTLGTPLPDFPGKANPIIFVSNTPIGDNQNIHPGDALTAIADPNVPIAGGGSYMFWWAPVPAGATYVNPVEGPLAMFKGAPAFEVSNTIHVWMYPQRANMIANPSLEDGATAAGYWASNSVLSVLAHPTGGHYLSTAATSSVRLTGVTSVFIRGPDVPVGGAKKLVIEMDCSADDWTPSTTLNLVAQYGSPNSSYQLLHAGSGVLNLWVSPDGTAGPITYASAAHGFADGSRHLINVTWNADNGTNSTVQYKKDGADLGTLVLGARKPTGLFNSSLPVDLGSNLFKGNIYSFKLWADDVLVASPDFTHMVAGQTNVTDAQGNVWTLQGAASIANPNPAGPILQSNVWPTLKGQRYEPNWTFQLKVRGNGPVKVGLVYWDRDGRGTGVDWGGFYNKAGVFVPDVWTPNPTTWTSIAVNRTGPQAYRAMLRVETQTGTFIEIDEILAEHGLLAGSQKQWGYFDGSTSYGSRDDYFWYGGANRAGKSYSMYYGGRRAVVGRLFAAPTDSATPIGILTDDELREAGMVYQWVPAGTTVVGHIGVLYPEDLVSDLAPQSATSVLPYSTPTTDGVANPWV